MKRNLGILLLSALLVTLLCPLVGGYALADYFIDDSDTRLLTRGELSSYLLEDLGYIRNEILARYGYPFQLAKYRDYFESQWWYSRDEDFDFNWLTSTEMKNVELIKKLESEYGAAHGDDDDYEEGDGFYGDDGDDVYGYYYIDDSNARLLTKSELREYSLEELGYIRNEILARYGFPFQTEKYRSYFEEQSWYYRDEGFDYNWLSATEMKNVELIKAIEQEKGD